MVPFCDMGKIMITKQLKVEIDRNLVLNQIDCRKDSDFYEEIIEEYEEILEEMYSLCDPVFIMEKSEIGPELAREELPEGTPVLLVISSIGKGISEYSTKAFANGDYVKGMLSDAMADSALFSLEKEFEPLLKDACAKYQMGIKRRLEAPQDIAMEAQRFVWEKTNAQQLCGMGISTGYMLDPIKSNAVIYVLTDDKEVFRHQHDCRACTRYNCKFRNIPDIPIQIYDGGNVYQINVKKQESILDALVKMDNSFAAVCGGKGKCGKCKIRVLKGYQEITSYDEKYFTKDELEKGMRLACKAYPIEPLAIELNFKNETSFNILTEHEEKKELNTKNTPTDELGVAVDIGTTTIAIQLLNLTNKSKISTYTTVNHQRGFGADVISRIKASIEGKKNELRKCIRDDLEDGIRSIVKKTCVDIRQIKEVVISGNTTMIHLLMGYECKTLGVYPFTPVNIASIEDSYNNILDSDFLSARVRIIPGMSTFVGGDITSGIYQCDIDKKEECSLLIDLGTNGELVIGNKNKVLVTSTAAGPAFEGGNIEWGVGSIRGAIAGVTIHNGEVKLKTIEDAEPTGICGTGVIEITAELVRAGLIDETGYMDDEFFDDGYTLAKTINGEKIVFTQKDVREIQLAKSAVRAGIETIILRYGIEKNEISNVYLAGGFGYKLDCQKAIEIGMIPGEFSGKIKAVGNSSLGGAVKYLLSEDGWDRTAEIGDMAEEINLSADKLFNQFYMQYMEFS